MVPSAIVAVVTALAAGRILAGPIVDITKDNYEEHMRSGDWLLKLYSYATLVPAVLVADDSGALIVTPHIAMSASVPSRSGRRLSLRSPMPP